MEITRVLSKIAAVLNKLEIPYAVMGGVAVTIWGRARYTTDINIVVDLEYVKKWAGKQEIMEILEKLLEKIKNDKRNSKIK